MGIPALWDVIKGEDRIFSKAELAEVHFKEHGRPLRIAVDEADWVFNNVTKEHVEYIRKKFNQPAYRGIEKNIFFRICGLLALNIQLLFVFDSPKRPPKRSRRRGTVFNPKDSEDLRKVLDAFGIPYHQAKCEAEVECVQLQRLGVVDAVWSQDSDCLMFGSDFLIHDNRVAKELGDSNRSKGSTVKDSSTVRVVRGSEIREKHGMDRDGLLLFAMLSGGDFNPQGLKNCGRVLAVRAVRDGIGKGLSDCRTQADCLKWSGKLVTWLSRQANTHNVDVALNYPDIRVLDMYNKPTVFSDTQLLNLECLRNGWVRPIDELNLLMVTSSFFNIWGKDYMRWIGPILLTRWLVARDPSLPRGHFHKISFINQRVTRVDGEPTQPLPPARKLRFSPFGLTSLQRRTLAEYWTREVSVPVDPNLLVEAVVPVYLLERALLLEIPTHSPGPEKVPRKRARDADIDAGEIPPTTQKKTRTVLPNGQPNSVRNHATSMRRATFARDSSQPSTPTQARRLVAIGSAPASREYVSLLSDSDDDALRICSDSEDDDNQLRQAIALSLQNQVKSPRTPTTASALKRANSPPIPRQDKTSSDVTYKTAEYDFIDLTL